MYKKLALLKLNQSEQRVGRDGFLGIFGRKVDLLDKYEKKLEDLEDNMRMEQSSLTGKVGLLFCLFINFFETV